MLALRSPRTSRRRETRRTEQRAAARRGTAVAAARLARIRTADLALDEPRHEAAVLEADDLRADAELRREQRRLVLVPPVDAEQLRVLAADTQHERLAAHRDLEVVIRDAAAERLDRRLLSWPQALDETTDVQPGPDQRRLR